MGLIRGALHIAAYGGVSSKSKKQRMASMQLAATQGKSETEIKIAGSRNFDWGESGEHPREAAKGAARQAASRACGRVARLATRSTRRWGRGLPRWSRSDGHMSWCPDGTGGFDYEGPVQGTVGWSPFATSLTVRARGSMNETDNPSGERASVSEPVPAAA